MGPEESSQEPIVFRPIPPDVKADTYLQTLDSVRKGNETISPEAIKDKTQLLDALNANAKDLSVVIRGGGNITKNEANLGGTKLEMYQAEVQSDKVNATLLPDYGTITIAVPGKAGFNENGRPRGGFEIVLPDGSGKPNWLENNTFTLTELDDEGNFVRGIDLKKDLSPEDTQLFAKRYQTAVSKVTENAANPSPIETPAA